MLPSQLILSAIILLIILRTFVNYRLYRHNRYFYLLWLCLWTLILYFTFNTELLTKIARQLGIGRGVDFAVYLAIIIIFYLIFLLFIKINKLSVQIAMIIKKISLFEAELNKK